MSSTLSEIVNGEPMTVTAVNSSLIVFDDSNHQNHTHSYALRRRRAFLQSTTSTMVDLGVIVHDLTCDLTLTRHDLRMLQGAAAEMATKDFWVTENLDFHDYSGTLAGIVETRDFPAALRPHKLNP